MTAVLAKIDPIERDIDLLISEDLSPQAQSELFAEFAIETKAEAQQTNAAVLGHTSPVDTFVDGRKGAAEISVKPSGVISYEFQLTSEVFAWIDEQLMAHSPVGGAKDKHPGLYRRSHQFFADGVEADALLPPPGIQVGEFVNTTPYARRIERGSSSQQPEGVYEVVAALAARRFGNIARVSFVYLTVNAASRAERNKSDNRFPAIRVTVL